MIMSIVCSAHRHSCEKDRFHAAVLLIEFSTHRPEITKSKVTLMYFGVEQTDSTITAQSQHNHSTITAQSQHNYSTITAKSKHNYSTSSHLKNVPLCVIIDVEMNTKGNFWTSDYNKYVLSLRLTLTQVNLKLPIGGHFPSHLFHNWGMEGEGGEE